MSLNDLSAFKSPGVNWHIAGNATADLNRQSLLSFNNGTGVLVNIPEGTNAVDIFTFNFSRTCFNTPALSACLNFP